VGPPVERQIGLTEEGHDTSPPSLQRAEQRSSTERREGGSQYEQHTQLSLDRQTCLYIRFVFSCHGMALQAAATASCEWLADRDDVIAGGSELRGAGHHVWERRVRRAAPHDRRRGSLCG
jgi:hypothetical protein